MSEWREEQQHPAVLRIFKSSVAGIAIIFVYGIAIIFAAVLIPGVLVTSVVVVVALESWLLLPPTPPVHNVAAGPWPPKRLTQPHLPMPPHI